MLSAGGKFEAPSASERIFNRVFGLLVGLVVHALAVTRFDRWMLLLTVGTFAGAYPLMYFAQEFIPLNAAMFAASAVVLVVIAIRSLTIMSVRLALFGTILPAAAMLAVTLVAAIHTRFQGILITVVGMAMFIVAMLLIPRMKLLHRRPADWQSAPA